MNYLQDVEDIACLMYCSAVRLYDELEISIIPSSNLVIILGRWGQVRIIIHLIMIHVLNLSIGGSRMRSNVHSLQVIYW